MTEFNERENGKTESHTPADPTIQQQIGAAIRTATDYVKNWQKEAGVPDGAVAVTLGAVLGSITVAAFTKAWPALKTPVVGAGYLVSGYALSRLARRAYQEGQASPEPQA
jgi:hypothetical protein